MDILLEEILSGIPDRKQLTQVIVRLLVAMILGAIVGVQRERTGKAAGVRTHILVALGAALFVIGPEESGIDSAGLSRIIQGLVTGIGFLGAGAILKNTDTREIEGLTTAAGIWMTAAIGVAAGLGRTGMAIVSVALTWIILAAEFRIAGRNQPPQTPKNQSPNRADSN
jgi:putative Mg2+ transporter-C (MgtC) family protein